MTTSNDHTPALSRADLTKRHGTPRGFAAACNQAADDLYITTAECDAAVEKYQREWNAAPTDMRRNVALCLHPSHPGMEMEWNPHHGHWECGSCGCVDQITPSPNGREQLPFDVKHARALAFARKNRGDDLLPGDEELMARDTL